MHAAREVDAANRYPSALAPVAVAAAVLAVAVVVDVGAARRQRETRVDAEEMGQPWAKGGVEAKAAAVTKTVAAAAVVPEKVKKAMEDERLESAQLLSPRQQL